MDTQPQLEDGRDNDVVASLAVTLDGYVAQSDGGVDLFEEYPLTDFDFGACTEPDWGSGDGPDDLSEVIGMGMVCPFSRVDTLHTLC